MTLKIGCIGSGNMGYALMKGALSKGAVTGIAGNIAGSISIGFSDEDKNKAREAAESLGNRVYQSNSDAAADSDIIFLAVKPQVMEAVLNEISPIIKRRVAGSADNPGAAPIVVSMAAGWSIKKIQSILEGGNPERSNPSIPVARIMPNTPALVSQGMIALALSPGFPEDRAGELEKILCGAGHVDRVGENLLDAITGLSGSGPAYVSMFIEALADGGVLAGLPREKALLYAVQTVKGSAAMLLETGKHPGELKDMVASPGGTTIAGISALENGAFRAAVINSVEASWLRAKEIGSEMNR